MGLCDIDEMSLSGFSNQAIFIKQGEGELNQG
jgi:hypothetical protein